MQGTSKQTYSQEKLNGTDTDNVQPTLDTHQSVKHQVLDSLSTASNPAKKEKETEINFCKLLHIYRIFIALYIRMQDYLNLQTKKLCSKHNTNLIEFKQERGFDLSNEAKTTLISHTSRSCF